MEKDVLMRGEKEKTEKRRRYKIEIRNIYTMAQALVLIEELLTNFL